MSDIGCSNTDTDTQGLEDDFEASLTSVTWCSDGSIAYTPNSPVRLNFGFIELVQQLARDIAFRDPQELARDIHSNGSHDNYEDR